MALYACLCTIDRGKLDLFGAGFGPTITNS